MKRLIARTFDLLMPPAIQASGLAEELARARMTIFLLLLILGFAVVGALFYLAVASFLPDAFEARTFYLLSGAACGYLLGLWLFRRTASNVISANVMACTYFVTIFLGLQQIGSDQTLIGGLLYLLALPLLVALADYRSGIVWVPLVALAPVLLSAFGFASIEPLFLGNWVALCLGIFVSIYGSHHYLDRLSQRLNFVAAHDPLTGLANRSTFDRRLYQSTVTCRLQETKAVLVYIDLDRFKPINDTHGHQAGDAVLVAVAERLRRLVRETDTVARLGGDEFAILFDQCELDGILPIVDHLTALIAEPVEFNDSLLRVGCSLGVVVCPDDGVDPEQLARTADQRMYMAKRRDGGGRGATISEIPDPL